MSATATTTVSGNSLGRPAHETGLANVRSEQDTSREMEASKDLSYASLVEELRSSVRESRLTAPVEFRIQQLQQLRRAHAERADDIMAAIKSDMRRHEIEAFQGEVGSTLAEVDYAIANIKEWTTPERVGHPLTLQPGQSYIVKQPKGVVLIIAPFNFPVHLAFAPLIAAIAAGNTAVIKPSEMTPECSRIIEEIVNQYLDPRVVRVVQGAIPETTALLRERWDHIFYTGNGTVGRIVMNAAAKHLTPTTLELGGKSPVYVDRHANLQAAANRILHTKMFNNGQVCIAPDYVLVNEEVQKEFIEKLKTTAHQMLGDDPKQSESLARLIHQRHFDRLVRVLQESHGGETIVGGLDGADREDRYIQPTVIVNPQADSAMMTEEIFGPVLPVLTVRNDDEAIRFINSRESPLALYVFSENEEVYSKVIDCTLAGGSCINDCLFQISNPQLPFGGVGTSGMGKYHGKFGFDELSHFRSVMFRSTWLDPKDRYPPYDKSKVDVFKKIFIGPFIPEHVKKMMMLGSAAAVGLMFMRTRM